MNGFRIEAVDDRDGAWRRLIGDGLGAYNVGRAPMEAPQPLTLIVRDAAGAPIGGLAGETETGWLFVALLWLPEAARGRGLGTALMRAAEAEALRRGCRHAWLDTYDFQARPFYERLGYVVFGQLDDFPPGHSRYFMRKLLSSAEAAAT